MPHVFGFSLRWPGATLLTIVASTQTPLGPLALEASAAAAPRPVPALIRAVDYDAGGEGVGYHDADALNRGGSAAYRPTEGVDTMPSSAGGYQVGWTAAGEWLRYTVSVPQTADYSLHVRSSSEGSGSFHIEVDGVDVSGPLTATTGRRDVYQHLGKIPVRLAAGTRVIRVVIRSSGVNLLSLRIEKVTEKGTRILGMDTANSAESANPLDAFYRARAAGAEATSLSLNWNQIEPSPNVYVDPYGLLATANAFYSANDTRISLTIRPVDANSKPVPSDLRDVPFNDPRMIDRFTRMLRFVLQRMPDATFTSIQIGNEIDKHVTLDVGAYAALVLWSNVQIKSMRPDVKVGYTATLDGLVTAGNRDVFQWLNPYVDVVGVTYYPVDGNLQVRDPAVVHADVDALMSRHPNNMVFLQEIGYPSGALSGSSDFKQQDFVQNVFAAWDRYADRIGYASFVRVQDWSQTEADRAASSPPYNMPYPAFAEFLRTLGMRTYPSSGQDKPALATLFREAAGRGWSPVSPAGF